MFLGFKDAQIPTCVFYEGRQVDHFVAVDTGSGAGWKYLTDESGNLVVRGDEVPIVRVFGSFRLGEPDRGK